MARAPLRAGDPARIGHYQLTARLGSGGMGVVYLGARWDGSHVAVKVLRPELADDPDFRRRFRREVAALMRVKGVCLHGAADRGRHRIAAALHGHRVRRRPVPGRVHRRLRAASPPDALRPGHRAGRGADRDPRGRPRAPGPQALQRDPDPRRTEGHRLRHRPGPGRHVHDPDRHDGRLVGFHGSGADQRAPRPAGRHLRLGGDGGVRGHRAVTVRPGRHPRRLVPGPARRARYRRRSRAPAHARRRRPGQGPGPAALRPPAARPADQRPGAVPSRI